LFCVHHDDDYPAGDDALGPAASLAGRNLGNDFEVRDGWRMYHGRTVPGFPRHPHRGFETITLARRGHIDHSDSLGATARFGRGDVQWMTAGRGIVHCEMFPLIERDRRNPTELFQIWLNLPRARKMVPPHFTMLWADTIPREVFTDAHGGTCEVVTVAGSGAPRPPPASWASEPENHVAIWTLALSHGARWTIPAAPSRVGRMLYLFSGGSFSEGGVTVDGQALSPRTAAELKPDAPVDLRASGGPAELLLLQGAPIDEPIAHHGPFVMNTPAGLRQAFFDYQRTGFGGWPWEEDGPVHPREQGRFAIHLDGRREEPLG